MIVSILVAAAWSALNLWVLAQCLNGMTGLRRYTRWQWAGLLGLKAPVLYGSAWWYLQQPRTSAVGCAIGVTLVLALGVGWAVRQSLRAMHCEQGGAG